MKRLPNLVSVDAIIHGVLKLKWDDGYEGIVDMRPVIDRGRIFSYLSVPANFSEVRLDEYGHSISWTNEKGEEIDFSADGLRDTAEKQAKAHKFVAELIG